MANIRNQPSNLNYLSQTKFRFVLNRAPNVGFFCQKATLPAITLATTSQVTPFMPVNRPGARIEYENYPVTFKVNEDLSNYLEIFNWMNNLGFPEDFSGYDAIKKSGQEVASDATMIIESSKNNPNIQIVFRDIFPVSLSELEFTDTDDTIEYQDATVVFSYQRFTITKLNTKK